jgi:hypothetical protein
MDQKFNFTKREEFFHFFFKQASFLIFRLGLRKMADEADKEAVVVELAAPTDDKGQQKEEGREVLATKKPTKFMQANYVQNIEDDEGNIISWDLRSKKDIEFKATYATSITGPTDHTFNATVVGEVWLRHVDPEVRKLVDEEQLLVLQRGMKLITRDGKEFAFVYALVTNEVVENRKSNERTLKERDSSVFVPIISHMF